MSATPSTIADFQAETVPVLLDEGQSGAQTSPLLTLAIPAYRHAQFIKECLSGLVAIERKDALEIIFLDDASPDETVQIAQECLRQLGISFRLYRRPQNAGLTAGLEFLLDEARGRFVLFCASDDRVLPESVDDVCEMVQSPDFGRLAFVICGADYSGDRNGPVYDRELLSRVTSSAALLHKWVSQDFPRPLLLQSTVFRTEFLREVDPWRQRLLLDDWPTFILASARAASKNLDIRFEPDTTLVVYRVHAGGLHAVSDRQINACLETVEKVVPESVRGAARSKVLAEAALSHLSRGQFLDAARVYVRSITSGKSTEAVLLAPRLLFQALRRRLLKALFIKKS